MLSLVGQGILPMPLWVSTSFILLKTSQVINKNHSLLRIYFVPSSVLSIFYLYNIIGLHKNSVRRILLLLLLIRQLRFRRLRN